MDCALYTHHPLGLINKRLSFLCIWTDTCLTAQTIFPGGFSDAIRALTAILVISKPYRPIRLKRTDGPYQQPPVLNPPTTRIPELGEDRSEGMPCAWPTLPQSQPSTCRMNDPLSSAENSTCGTTWHDRFTFMLLDIDFFCARDRFGSNTDRMDRSKQTAVWSDKRNLWRVSKGSRSGSSRQADWGLISSGPKDMDNSVTCVLKAQ